MVLFQLVSDLHIESLYPKFPDILDYLVPCAKMLILAGDIGNLEKIDQLSHFLTTCTRSFSAVFYIPGNNEYKNTNKSFQELKDQFHILKMLKGLVILDDNSYFISRYNKKYMIIGSTFWNDRRPETPESLRVLYYMNLFYIKEKVNTCRSLNIVPIVVTHFPPSFQDLSNVLPDIWIHGHNHKNRDWIYIDDRETNHLLPSDLMLQLFSTTNRVQIICNQFGGLPKGTFPGDIKYKRNKVIYL